MIYRVDRKITILAALFLSVTSLAAAGLNSPENTTETGIPLDTKWKPKSPEAIVFHDADTLDFLGTIGLVRIVGLTDHHGWTPNLPGAIDTLKGWTHELPYGGPHCLDKI